MSEDHKEDVVENDSVIDEIADEVGMTASKSAELELELEVGEMKMRIKDCIALLDPTGCGHVSTGSPAKYQQILEVLNKAVEG